MIISLLKLNLLSIYHTWLWKSLNHYFFKIGLLSFSNSDVFYLESQIIYHTKKHKIALRKHLCFSFLFPFFLGLTMVQHLHWFRIFFLCRTLPLTIFWIDERVLWDKLTNHYLFKSYNTWTRPYVKARDEGGKYKFVNKLRNESLRQSVELSIRQ